MGALKEFWKWIGTVVPGKECALENNANVDIVGLHMQVALLCCLILFVSGDNADAKCKILKGIDYQSDPEDLLNNALSIPTFSDQECCQRCQEVDACVSWSRVQTIGSINDAGACWMRSKTGVEVKNEEVNSGLKKDFDALQSCAYAHGFDFKGGAFLNDGSKTITKSPEECCKLCARRKGCKAWTRTRFWSQGSEEGECWLRGKVGFNMTRYSTTSGMKPDVPKAVSSSGD